MSTIRILVFRAFLPFALADNGLENATEQAALEVTATKGSGGKR